MGGYRFLAALSLVVLISVGHCLADGTSVHSAEPFADGYYASGDGGTVLLVLTKRPSHRLRYDVWFLRSFGAKTVEHEYFELMGPLRTDGTLQRFALRTNTEACGYVTIRVANSKVIVARFDYGDFHYGPKVPFSVGSAADVQDWIAVLKQTVQENIRIHSGDGPVVHSPGMPSCFPSLSP